jgi:hypothetical protein
MGMEHENQKVALELIARVFGRVWSKPKGINEEIEVTDKFNTLCAENKDLDAYATTRNIKLLPSFTLVRTTDVQIVFQSGDPIIIKDDITTEETRDSWLNLVTDIMDWINYDPILHRIYLHNIMVPDDIDSRELLRNDYPVTDAWIGYFEFIFYGLKRLLPGNNPYLIHQILMRLLADHQHFLCVDGAKRRGATKTIAELRKQLGIKQQEDEKWVCDYTPWFKDIYSKTGIRRDVFHEEDFMLPTDDDFDQASCRWLQRAAKEDRRDKANRYFNFNDLAFEITLKGHKPLRRNMLMNEHYLKNIQGIAKRANQPLLSNKHEEDVIEGQAEENKVMRKIKLSENEVILLKALYDAQLKYKPYIAPAWPWMTARGTGPLALAIQKEYERADYTTTDEEKRRRKLYEEELRYSYPNTKEEDIQRMVNKFQSRVLREDLDNSGGSLNDLLSEEDDTEQQDVTPDIKARSPLMSTMVRDFVPKDMKVILNKKVAGIPLTDTERQQLKRFRDDLEKQGTTMEDFT